MNGCTDDNRGAFYIPPETEGSEALQSGNSGHGGSCESNTNRHVADRSTSSGQVLPVVRHFIAAKVRKGPRIGMVFKTCEWGMGYHFDPGPMAVHEPEWGACCQAVATTVLFES